MNKILLVVQREYLSRVRKKSFIIMTFLGPLLIAGFYAVTIWLAIKGDELGESKRVKIVDESAFFEGKLKDSKNIHFSFNNEDITTAKADYESEGFNYLLHISAFDSLQVPSIELFSKEQPGMSLVNHISGEIESVLEAERMVNAGINQNMLDKIKARVEINTIRLTEEGERDSNTELAFAIGMLSGIIIYISIFIYGVQVMRGIIEEKTNRIVEVIISSVRPFQLMMGKIIGIAFVGLTQFLLWIVLTAGISTVVTPMFLSSDKIEQFQQLQEQNKTPLPTAGAEQFNNNQLQEIVGALDNMPIGIMVSCFIFYFVGGYLLYSALFAAIGSAVDNETETQQFMFPITLPLIFAFIISSSFVVNNPANSLSVWLSMIPLTSPVVMMVRLPFGVPAWQIACSISLLILGFVGTVWVAARIYRTGILMYGKKVSYKELAKWLFYKG